MRSTPYPAATDPAVNVTIVTRCRTASSTGATAATMPTPAHTATARANTITEPVA